MNASREDFWEWSARAYARPGVKAQLLDLQDAQALNVNILLWCCWTGTRRGAPSELVIRKAIDLTSAWSRDVTGALRAARRALKSPPRQAPAEGVEALRAKVKSAELDAEKLEQGMLQALAEDASPRARDAPAALGEARRALARYADLAGAVGRRGFSMLMLDDLARAVIADAPNEAPDA